MTERGRRLEHIERRRCAPLERLLGNALRFTSLLDGEPRDLECLERPNPSAVGALQVDRELVSKRMLVILFLRDLRAEHSDLRMDAVAVEDLPIERNTHVPRVQCEVTDV